MTKKWIDAKYYKPNSNYIFLVREFNKGAEVFPVGGAPFMLDEKQYLEFVKTPEIRTDG